MKTIRCPFCMSKCEIGTGYYHDENLNVRCGRCHSVMMATSEEDEKPLAALYTRPIKDTHDTATNAMGYGWPQHGAGVNPRSHPMGPGMPHNHNFDQPGHGRAYPGMMGSDYDGEYD